MSKSFFALTLLAGAAMTGCMQSTAKPVSTATANTSDTPRNIIMVVADGMGPAYTTAYRNYQDDPATEAVESVVFDDILIGSASTYPHQQSGYVTDSAAAATALASGTKTYNGAIGVDAAKQPLESVMMRARQQGKRTGLAVTSQIVHATPASYIAHDESRKNYNAIADDFYDNRVNGQHIANVMLGGGTRYFERDDRDVLAQFIDDGYAYADSYNRLAAIPQGSDVIGLFADVALPPVLDDKRKNRLAYMTEHAIKHLENDNGFFLLVEASQIDWAGHSNDIASAMAEMHDLAQTMEMLREYVEAHPDTLVILTADHSTGGLTVGARGDYRWSPEFLSAMQASVGTIASNMGDEAAPGAYVAGQLGFTLSDDEVARFDELAGEPDVNKREAQLKQFLDEKTNTGWTTSGHTGVDVEVFAFGAGSQALAGQHDNTDIAAVIFEHLKGSSMQTPVSDNKGTPSGDDDACDFKEDWRCH
ncbi:alkaline phosphatase [Alteromonas halophila]|uniref:Alkaline phosphatase n=1 Tax=Alteromonas halophila TaxID=516698 RepID=A0A918JL15_9ALTE|nr:alkaline phosphatase [Alteromonas halophila]GGW86807.1 alkaline phosphatase [Alteromonas halophila]